MRRCPIDGERFVHLNVLTGLDAAAAKNALVRVIAIERIGPVLFIWLRLIGSRLVLHIQVRSGVVNGAVLIVLSHTVQYS